MESLDPADDDAREFLDEDLRRIARRLSQDSHSADDLVQDAWLAQRRRSADETPTEKSWLKRVLLNLARQRWRSERRRVERERDASKPEEIAPSEVGDGDEIAALRASIAELREPYRSVIELHYLEELPFAEVAERLGRSEATLRSQHTRALEILRGRGRRGARALTPFAALVDRMRQTLSRRRRALQRAAAGAGGLSWIVRWLVPATIVAIVAVLFVRPEPERAIRADGVAFAVNDPAEARLGLEVASDSAERTERRTSASPAESAPRDAATTASAAPRFAVPTPRVLNVAVRDVYGAPIPLAQVRMRSDPEHEPRTWTTDAHGALEIPIDSAGTTCDAGREYAWLTAYAEGFASRLERRVAIDADPSRPIELSLGEGELRVEGRVVDARGAPLPGLTIKVYSRSQRSFEAADGTCYAPLTHETVTRADGSFALDRLPRERRKLDVLRDGITVHERFIDPRRSSDTLEIQILDSAFLTGTVLRADGRPAVGASVYVERFQRPPGRAVLTDAQGRFRTDALPPGSTRAWATLPGAEYQTATKVIELSPGNERVWNCALAPRAPIVVKIVNSDGTPAVCTRVDFARYATDAELADASEATTIGVFDAWLRSAQTDEFGRVVLHPAPDRPVDVKVFHPDFNADLAVQVELGVAPSEEAHEIVLPPAVPPGSVAGWIVDARGRPNPRAMLRISDQRTGHWTHAELDPSTGRFRVDRLPPSEYRLQVSLDESDNAELCTVTVRAGESHDLGELRAPPRSTVKVRWSWPSDGSASRRYQLAQVAMGSGRVVEFLTDTGPVPPAAGWELFPGTFTLRVREGDEVRHLQQFSVPPDCELVIESGPAGRYSVTVRIRCGKSASPREVNVAVQRADSNDAVTSEVWPLPASGTITRCVYLDAGRYVVTAESSDGLWGTASAHASEKPDRVLVDITLR